MIKAIRQRGELGALTGLVTFAALILLPCFCASAWAYDVDQDEDCCPLTVGEKPGQESDDTPGADCCCDGASASSVVADGSEAVMSENGVGVTPPERDFSDWVPTVLAVLWLAQRMEVMKSGEVGAPLIDEEQVQPDGRSTYLNQEILRI